jgi:metal-responsive CopG/Arc/MetJ family transcriptional regulator
MPSTEPVTVALPLDIVRDIDRMETNRSKFILDAVHHELQRRRREKLELALRAPHPERRIARTSWSC